MRLFPARRALLTRLAICVAVGSLGLLGTVCVTPALAVVGGAEATIADFPFQVALYDPQMDPNPANSQFCGGVILDERHILTAAHCVFNNATGQAAPAEMEVLAGTNNLNTAQQTEHEYTEHPVKETSFDPRWNRETGEHDLAVLTLSGGGLNLGKVPGVSTIASVPLLSAEEAEALVKPGVQATVSGWGDMHEEPTTMVRPAYALKLNSARVPIVEGAKCASEYGLTALSLPDFVCAGAKGVNACFGDDGGPLVVEAGGSPAPGDYRLLATFGFSSGCGLLPGAYQSVAAPENAGFIKSEPPQAPLDQIPPSISGTPQAGQTLTCNAGAWTGAPSFTYEFFSDQSTFGEPAKYQKLTLTRSPSASYAVPSSLAAGTRIFCVVVPLNAGGYAEVPSADVTVIPPPAPDPVSPAPAVTPDPPATTTTSTTAITSTATTVSSRPSPPTLELVSKLCGRTSCTLNVRASEGAEAAAVMQVEAKLTFLQRYPCREGTRPSTCTRTATRRLLAKPTPGAHFVIVASPLAPGTYTVSMVAIDRMGVHELKPTTVALAVKAPVAKKSRQKH
jgi:hypothetical protein